MSEEFGMEIPRKNTKHSLKEAARYLVIIDSDSSAIARLFLENHEQVEEFDASTEEVTSMISDLVPDKGAAGPEWDKALGGHTMKERAEAVVYKLSV